MKYMITAALALCLAGGAAAAQDHDHGGDRGGGRDGGREEHRGGGPGSYRGGPPGAPDAGQTHGFRAGPQGPQGGPPQVQGPRGGDRRAPDGDRHDFRGPEGFRGDRRDFRGPEPGYRPGYYLHDRGWHGGGRFRAPYYRYPSGWGYRRWAFGAFLPGVFLAPDYFIGSYWTYGLPAPPPGYHWIRVGPDALLVRYGDGYVLDAVYGIFY